MKKVIIVGAGPGGLTAGMILSHKGYDVTIYEKRGIVGGRNGFIKAKGFTFDIGPTFFLMKDVLEEIFLMSGKNAEDYLEFKQLDPMYKLKFKDIVFHPYSDYNKMVEELEKVFPGSKSGYDKYLERERIKYDRLIPCLEVPYGKISDFFSSRIIRAIPYLDLNQSFYNVLGRYFEGDDLKTSFTFQAKYIGMSPWEAPGLFSIISFIEHGGGVFHVKGGLNQLSNKMSQVVVENGGKLKLKSSVKEVLVENGKAVGVELEDDTIDKSDYVILNSDFAHTMKNLVNSEHRSKYSDDKLRRMKYSVSTFMLYLGLNKIYENIEHHNIYFAEDYEKNVKEMTKEMVLSNDPSFYIQNASRSDDSLAPEGKSALYILVPVPNNTSGINWEDEKDDFTRKVLNALEYKAELKDLRKNIEYMKVITPEDWEKQMDVYNGATFNLAHNLGQMLYLRPHNEFEDIRNCYLVGGGTHPGSGLPTIYESGKISANMIMERDNI